MAVPIFQMLAISDFQSLGTVPATCVAISTGELMLLSSNDGCVCPVQDTEFVFSHRGCLVSCAIDNNWEPRVFAWHQSLSAAVAVALAANGDYLLSADWRHGKLLVSSMSTHLAWSVILPQHLSRPESACWWEDQIVISVLADDVVRELWKSTIRAGVDGSLTTQWRKIELPPDFAIGGPISVFQTSSRMLLLYDKERGTISFCDKDGTVSTESSVPQGSIIGVTRPSDIVVVAGDGATYAIDRVAGTPSLRSILLAAVINMDKCIAIAATGVAVGMLYSNGTIVIGTGAGYQTYTVNWAAVAVDALLAREIERAND